LKLSNNPAQASKALPYMRKSPYKQPIAHLTVAVAKKYDYE